MNWRPALGIFVTALSVRLIHVAEMRDTLFFAVLMGDSRGYDAWATRLAAGDWFGSEVFYQAPLYPYVLGVIYAVFGRDLLVVRVIQALVGALSCVALGYAATRLISRTAGIVAGLMLALYAPAIFFDGLIQKSTLDVLFVCLTLALIGRISANDGGRGSWLLLGGVMGALTLTRENALVLVGCVVVWAVRRRWESALVFAAGLTLVLVPVAIRNYAVGGGLYLTTSQFGSNFYIGNNPRADGSYTSLRAGRGSPEYERFDATAMAEQATGRRLTPAEVSRYWTDRALAFIRDDPRAWLALTARKARLLWSANEMIDTESLESHAEHSQPLRVAAGIWNFGVLLPLAVVGGVVLWSQRRRLWILYLLPAAYAASVVLFFVVARYRYPMVPFVMIFAAAGATGLPAFVRAAPGSRVIATVIAAATLAVIAFWPQHTAEARRAITENNLGAALQEDGRVTEAVEHYRRALALDAHYTPALSNLGTALRAAGRVDDAIGVYEQALAQQPASASAHYNMANALMAQGRTDEAIVHFREAITADPRHLEAHHNLGRALETAGRIDEALAVFHRALALAPGNAGARYDLGSLMLERGSFSPAAEVLRDAIRIRPDYAEAHNNLGIALASQGAIDEAVRHWEEAVRLKPGFTDAQRNLQMARQTRQK